MGDLIMRTVLELRTPVPKYLLQTLLLAASWHRYARQIAPLEVRCIGDLPPRLQDRLFELGVAITQIEPNQNDNFSKTSNTIQGAAPADGKRILLIDNDVVFSGSPTELGAIDRGAIHGAVAGNARVKPQQWVFLAELGYKPHPCRPEPPRTALLRAKVAGRAAPPSLDISYVNGGVVVFPSGTNFQSDWQSKQKEIADAFLGHPLDSDSVRKSNMTALAVTIGAFGKFDWLPYGYNYRHADFALGLCESHEIKLIHMTGLGKRTEAISLSRWVIEYWAQKMTHLLGQLKPCLSGPEFDRRSHIAATSLRRILDVITDYELDPLAQKLIVERASILT